MLRTVQMVEACLQKFLREAETLPGPFVWYFELRVCGSGHLGMEYYLATKKRPPWLRQSLFFRVEQRMMGVAPKRSKSYLTLTAGLGHGRVSQVELVLKRSWKAQPEALFSLGFSRVTYHEWPGQAVSNCNGSLSLDRVMKRSWGQVPRVRVSSERETGNGIAADDSVSQLKSLQHFGHASTMDSRSHEVKLLWI